MDLQVYTTPSSLPNAGAPNFVLAKLDCSSGDWREKAFEAINDNVITMILYGQSLTSIFVNFENEGGPKLYLYNLKYEGSPLDSLLKKKKGGGGGLDRKTSVMCFIDLCRELKALHCQGYAHFDLKPGNVIMDKAAGATLIDFGSVRRNWYEMDDHHTCSYALGSKKYYTLYFTELYLATFGNRPATSILNSLEKVTNYMDARWFAHRRKSREEMMSPYTTTIVNKQPFFYGVTWDIGSLTILALELGIWDSSTEPLFEALIDNFFQPSLLEPIITYLKIQVDQAEERSVKLNILTLTSGIEVWPSEEPGTPPGDVQEFIKNKYREYSGIAEYEDPTKTLDDSIKVFRKFKNIPEIYKQNEIDSKKSVDSKFYALTNLINSLNYIYDDITLRNTLARIFAVALINRNFFGASKTRSFDLLFTACKDSSIRSIIKHNFYSRLTEFTSREDFYTAVQDNITGLIVLGDQKTAFNKTSGFDTILKILDEQNVDTSKPITESEARSLLAKNSYGNSLKASIEKKSFLATYARAANPIIRIKDPKEESRITEGRGYITGCIEKSYNGLIAGFDFEEQMLAFENDISICYGVNVKLLRSKLQPLKSKNDIISA